MRNLELLTERVLSNQYIPKDIVPTSRQAEFLANQFMEVMYGGGAAGGKSVALLMAALMYVDVPDYNAIIFRKTFSDLSLPGALMDMSKTWLTRTDAKWHDLTKKWEFPSGATVSFGYLDTANARYRYQGAEFHLIAIDEVSQIDQLSYLYLFSRLRQKVESKVPLRMLSATNPPQSEDGMWTYARFIQDAIPHHLVDPDTGEEYVLYHERKDDEEGGARAFIPALYADNPYVSKTYMQSLNRLDWVTREQLLYGAWLVRADGGIYMDEWFDRWYDPEDPPDFEETCISCDLAFKDTAGADFTVYQAWGRYKKNYYLIDQYREKMIYPKAKEEFIKFCNRHPEIHRKIIEDKAAGQSLLQDLKDVVPGLRAYNPGAKSKMERAQLVSPLYEMHQVYLPLHRPWTTDFISEHVAFTGSTNQHNDMVDAASQALILMKRSAQKFYITSL